jgi:hypothetical protein
MEKSEPDKADDNKYPKIYHDPYWPDLDGGPMKIVWREEDEFWYKKKKFNYWSYRMWIAKIVLALVAVMLVTELIRFVFNLK